MADFLTLSAAERAFFARYGGVALGLRLLDEAAKHIHGLATPNWVSLSIEQLRSGEMTLNTSEFQRLATLEGRSVALKFSGIREAFSLHARRGANSSTRGPGPFVSDMSSAPLIARDAADSSPNGTCAIVLQEIVNSTPPINDVTVHATNDCIVIEARDEADVAIFEWSRERSWCETRTGAAVPRALQAEFETLAEMHRGLVGLLGFPINTEGFRTDGKFVAIQLRPLPTDLPNDPSLTAKVWRMAEHADTFITHFAHGVYDSQGVVVRDPTGAASPIGLFTKSPQPASTSGIAHHVLPTDFRALKAKWPLRNSVWPSTANITSHAAGLPFVLLDAVDAFHLSHDVRHLPPPGPLREHLRYAACGPIAATINDGSELLTVSDGNFAAIRKLQ